MTFKDILKKYINLDQKLENNKKFKCLLNKDIECISKGKRRKYDIDSNKKLLKKLFWNHIMNGLCTITDIKNIKQINDNIKHLTQKDFDRELMSKTILNAYSDFYKQDYNFLKKNLNTEKYEESHLIWYVNRTLMEMLIIFRNSEKFLYLAQVSAKNDNKKLKNFIILSKCFFNYLKSSEKKVLKNYENDTNIDNIQLNKFEEIIKQIDENKYDFIEDEEKTNSFKQELGFKCEKEYINNEEENPLSKFSTEQLLKEIKKKREDLLIFKKQLSFSNLNDGNNINSKDNFELEFNQLFGLNNFDFNYN